MQHGEPHHVRVVAGQPHAAGVKDRVAQGIVELAHLHEALVLRGDTRVAQELAEGGAIGWCVRSNAQRHGGTLRGARESVKPSRLRSRARVAPHRARPRLAAFLADVRQSRPVVCEVKFP